MITNYPRKGKAPHIGDNGHWFIGTVDTGIRANGQSNTEIIPVSIAASDWNAETKEVTIDCIGVSANEAEQIITLIPSTESKEICNKAGIDCSGFNTNTITLKATTIPAEDINIYVAIEATGDSQVKNVYSTEETVVGRWIDGKPIYRRACFTSLNLQVINQWAVAGIVIDDIDRCIHGSVLTEYGENSLIIIGNNVTTNQGIEVYTTTATGPIFCVILAYTKTTDTATISIPSATALTEAYEEGVNES